MTPSSKPLKPAAPGKVIKQRQHNADIRTQIGDEDAKHRAKLTDLQDREREIQVSPAPATLRAARLTRIVHQRAEENRRHHAAIERLNKSFQ